jgi:hypothetical protein
MLDGVLGLALLDCCDGHLGWRYICTGVHLHPLMCPIIAPDTVITSLLLAAMVAIVDGTDDDCRDV